MIFKDIFKRLQGVSKILLNGRNYVKFRIEFRFQTFLPTRSVQSLKIAPTSRHIVFNGSINFIDCPIYKITIVSWQFEVT